jgi:ribonucleoside-diphosphate reductase alpha chain
MTAELTKEVSRGKILQGRTFQYQSGCGTIYVTVNHTKTKQIREVFVTVGKSGSCMQAHAAAEGRLSSLFLRSGGNVDKLINHLTGLSCGNSKQAMGDIPAVLSCPSIIAQALKDAIEELKETR